MMEVPKDWLIEDFFEDNNIEKIDIVYLYDRNIITHLAEITGSYWLEPIAVIPTPDEEQQQQDAIDDIYPPFEGGYYNSYDISDKKSQKVDGSICNFTWSNDDEHKEKWEECLEFCRENQYLCM